MFVLYILLLFYLKVECFSTLCPRGYFILPGLTRCQMWLNCTDLSSIKLKKIIGYGTVKNVFLAEWKNHTVVFNELRSVKYRNDFLLGLDMLISLNPSPYVTQLIGSCQENNIIITEYHRFNNAVHVRYLLEIYGKNTIENRLKLCLNYAQILEFLHNSPVGTRVNCDTNELTKLLSQLLVTENFRLVLNDLDALPEVKKNSSVTCGPRPILSDFVAPEQRSNLRDDGRSSYKIPQYNEKTDIWKAANVCNFFIQGSDSEIVQYMLFETHKKCKSLNPNQRPTASFLVKKYSETLKDISLHTEL